MCSEIAPFRSSGTPTGATAGSGRFLLRPAAQSLPRWRESWPEVTGETLLTVVPAMARGVVAAVPYRSLVDLRSDLSVTERDARMLPAGVLSVVLGHEFLVPDEPQTDHLAKLADAVELSNSHDYREARRALYDWELTFVRAGETDVHSIERTVTEMRQLTSELRCATQKQRRWTAARRAFFVGQMVLAVACAPIPPIAAGNALLALGVFTATELLANPFRAFERRPRPPCCTTRVTSSAR